MVARARSDHVFVWLCVFGEGERMVHIYVEHVLALCDVDVYQYTHAHTFKQALLSTHSPYR